MPDGEYCDLMQGDPTGPTGCTGPTVTVSRGKANINVPIGDSPMSAITVDYRGTSGGGGSGGGSCSKPDNQKTDCGYLGVTQSACEAKGCCWAESSTPGTPWCYHK